MRNSESRSLQQRESQLEGSGKLSDKKKYATPRLVEYGTLAKLTRGASTGPDDGAGMSIVCL
ncbi:MAG: lasso RiPP family leader peptide-containing protein [Acidobacteria bacterium]|nr:lasso RiPP family leader peptide-containing protein [Acidobacteriota bacterium]